MTSQSYKKLNAIFSLFIHSFNDGDLTANLTKHHDGALHKTINSLVNSTIRPGYVDVDSMSGIFDLKACGYEDPYLVSGTDGVGTKLKVSVKLLRKLIYILLIIYN